MYLARRSRKCEKYVLRVNIDRIGQKCRINSRAVCRRQVSKNRNNPVVYLLTSLTEGRASILHRLLNYYMRFMASVESMGRRVRPHIGTPDAVSTSNQQLIVYWFSIFVFLSCSSSKHPKRFGGTYTIFRRIEISGIFSHMPGNVKVIPRNVRGIY